jgi:hypothetical protein
MVQITYTYVYKCKMISVDTIPGMGKGDEGEPPRE